MITRLSYTIFLVLLIASIYFYLERTVFLDISFHLFFLTKGDFAIQNSRFIAFLTQLFPLSGMALGLSLKPIMLLYSSAFVIVPFLYFLLIRYIVKDRDLSLIVVLSTFWLVSDTFFWIQSELPQGMWAMVLYFALFHKSLLQDQPNIWYQSFLSLIAFFLAFAHPLLIFPILYCFAFFGLKYKRTQFFWSQLVIYFSILIIKQLFFKAAYDSQAMGGLSSFKSLFPNYFTIDTNVQFLKYLINDYYLLLLGAIAVIAFYIKSKNWFQLLNYLIFSAFFLLLINVTYAGRNPEKFYIENLYLPLGMMLLFPLVLDVFKTIKREAVLTALISIVFIVRMIDIYSISGQYTDRVTYLESISDKLNEKKLDKLIIPASTVDNKLLKMNWGFPYEMWLLSTMKTGKTQSVVLENEANELSWTMERKDAFITNWGVFDYPKLNPRYFILPDSTQSYRYVEAPFE